MEPRGGGKRDTHIVPSLRKFVQQQGCHGASGQLEQGLNADGDLLPEGII